MDKIFHLSNERAWRTYIGGSLIDKLHGEDNGDDTHFPEEWIMSVTECRNAGREYIKGEGMSRLYENGELLLDVINKSPEAMLGKRHYNKFGAQTGVLVKLIDSAERLAIQVHPNKEKAKKYFNSDYGKTESWHILGGREINGEKPCIYIGFKNGITRDYWKKVFLEQDIEKMLGCLNKVEVKQGDTFLINGGVPHAIGAGCFLIEVQEPTDFTLRTERTTPAGFKISDELCHQGIGFENMFDCFDYDSVNAEKYRIQPKNKDKTKILIDYDSTEYFKLREIDVKDRYSLDSEDVFCGLYVIEGNGEIAVGDKTFRIEKGNQFFVPANTSLKIIAEKNLKIMQFNGPKL